MPLTARTPPPVRRRKRGTNEDLENPYVDPSSEHQSVTTRSAAKKQRLAQNPSSTAASIPSRRRKPAAAPHTIFRHYTPFRTAKQYSDLGATPTTPVNGGLASPSPTTPKCQSPSDPAPPAAVEATSAPKCYLTAEDTSALRDFDVRKRSLALQEQQEQEQEFILKYFGPQQLCEWQELHKAAAARWEAYERDFMLWVYKKLEAEGKRRESGAGELGEEPRAWEIDKNELEAERRLRDASAVRFERERRAWGVERMRLNAKIQELKDSKLEARREMFEAQGQALEYKKLGQLLQGDRTRPREEGPIVGDALTCNCALAWTGRRDVGASDSPLLEAERDLEKARRVWRAERQQLMGEGDK